MQQQSSRPTVLAHTQNFLKSGAQVDRLLARQPYSPASWYLILALVRAS